MMRVSVIMTTYNGEKYIYQQIDSIRKQTAKINEVIISDDCSTDGTVEIIEKYIEEYKLKNWKLYVNKKNLGWTRNFYQALRLASGDIIFCSDQDDIWDSRKVQSMAEVMQKDEKILALGCRKINVDEENDEIYCLNDESWTEKTRLACKLSRFNTLKLLGCCCAYRKSIVQKYFELNYPEYGHDIQLCRIAAIFEGAYILDQNLVRYRIHGNNTSGITASIPFGSSDLKKRIYDIENNIRFLEILLSKKIGLNSMQKKIIKKTITLQKERLEFEKKGWAGLAIWVKMFTKYMKFTGGYVMMADLCYATGMNKVGGGMLWYVKHLGLFKRNT